MKTQFRIVTVLLLVTAVFVQAQEDPNLCPYKPWLGRTVEMEQLLRTAEVKEFRLVGQGVTDPWKITLWNGGKEFHAAYKPIKEGLYSGYWESFQAEVAAYELDKMLDLNMVPPTVVKRIRAIRAKNDNGSLQLWVDSCSIYRGVQDKTPQTPSWSHEISRMKTFDVLINNDDRNAGNFLVCPEFHIILIDHSRAFTTRSNILEMPEKLPVSFDRKLVEKLKELTREDLDAHLRSALFENDSIRILKDYQVKAILRRRDALLARLRKLVTERGEARVLFN